MNRKIMARIISGRLATAELLEADYGVTAVDTLHAETAAGRKVDFVLMDFVMVSCLALHVFSFYFLFF